jgi:hypothetical protein
LHQWACGDSQRQADGPQFNVLFLEAGPKTIQVAGGGWIDYLPRNARCELGTIEASKLLQDLPGCDIPRGKGRKR